MNTKQAFKVLKFGGSSVAGATNMSRVLDIVCKEAADSPVVLVSSAIAGCTDALLDGSREAIEEMERRHRSIVTRLFTGEQRLNVQARIDSIFEELSRADEKVTFGEILSTTILAAKLEADGYKTKWLDSRLLVNKDNLPETYAAIKEAAAGADIYVAPGFICHDKNGTVCTLGRGGSDYSAALYAAAVGAKSVQIWTDVPGIMTANPKQVPAARTVPVMSYKEAFTMAENGAKVLYAPTVAPAMEKGIDIEIRNTFAPDGGYTVIGRQSAGSKVGLASAKDGELCRIVLVGDISIDDERTAAAALMDAGIVPVSTAKEQGCYVMNVRPAVENMALRALHKAFFETPSQKEIPVFIAGYGAVGKALADVIGTNADSICEKTGKKLVIAGIASSRKYSVDLAGLKAIEPMTPGNFIDEVCRIAPKGSVFIDATSSESIWKDYARIFSCGINIVSSNRRSLAVPYVDYAAMKASAKENGVFFRYETTVGAALPILESISRGAASSDRILSLEAIVSCTLNRILDDYVPGKELFASLVYKAWMEGLTETNPAMDLGGRDALRKLLILVREAGVHLDAEDVAVMPLIPETMFTMPPERFFQELESLEPVFRESASAAARDGKKLRYVAAFHDGKAIIRLEAVAPEHPAFYLKGTENAIIVRSALKPYPLLIKGPGEGALEAASSILSDILR